MRLPFLAAVCTAVALVPCLVRSDEGVAGAEPSPGLVASEPQPGADPAPSIVTEPPAPAVGPIRPILLVGLGAVGGGVTLAADAGLRVAPVTARFAWRGEFFHSGDHLLFPSGRVGWIFLERRWIAAHAGLGAGRLTRTYDEPTRRPGSAPAAVAEVGALVAPGWAAGPLLAVQLEALAPFGRRDPPGASLSAPALSATVSVNLLVVAWAWLFPPGRYPGLWLP